MLKYEKIIKEMTLDEKIDMCSGKDYWHTQDIPRLNIPSIMFSDGPHGLRVQKKGSDNLGINESEISTCFPSGATVCNSWNRNLIRKMGEALAEEALQEGVSVLLGPGVNIKRSPLCGRNFEYFSEDPYLTSQMAIEYIRGVQSKGIGTCVKHFAVNNQENRRRIINAVIDKRTLREIYLYAFEKIVKEAKPYCVMTAYNKVNGTYCSENKELLGILKNEWNYEGLVVTDWGGINNKVDGIIAGNELDMPGKRENGKQELKRAVETKKIKEEKLDRSVDRILDIVFKADKNKIAGYKYDKEKHHELACKIAEESIVLLKNDNILPLKQDMNIAIIGDMAEKPRYQGAGSSTINPYKLENVCNVLKENKIPFEYAKGYERIESKHDKKLHNEALEIAKKHDIVVIFAGLTENYESEGMDRENIELPKNQQILIEKICKENKNVIVVLSGGSAISFKWKDKVKGIVHGYLGGEAGASAIVNVLFGKVNPSGKLSETYPQKIEETPCYNNFPGSETTVEYRESIYVGYRYYDKSNKEVLFPFGYGLSYTTFKYDDLEINKLEDKVQLTFNLKNVGNYAGAEIAQVYVKQKNAKIFKPEKELKAFEKIYIDSQESKKVDIVLPREAFQYYNPETRKWSVEEGEYEILVGKSSQDICLKGEVYFDSTDLKIEKNYPKCYYNGNIQNVSNEDFEQILEKKIPNTKIDLKNITEENTIEQLKYTLVGRAIYNYQVNHVMKKLLKKQDTNKATKVMMDLQKPLKKFYEKKNGKYNEDMIKGFIEMAKGSYIKGIKQIRKGKKEKKK